MKKILAFMILMVAITSVSRSAPLQSRATIQGVNETLGVSASTSSWTAVPSTSTVDTSRGGLFLFNPTGNNATFNVVMSTNTSVSSSTNTVTVELTTGAGVYLDISGYTYAFVVSKHTSAETIYYQEIKLERD